MNRHSGMRLPPGLLFGEFAHIAKIMDFFKWPLSFPLPLSFSLRNSAASTRRYYCRVMASSVKTSWRVTTERATTRKNADLDFCRPFQASETSASADISRWQFNPLGLCPRPCLKKSKGSRKRPESFTVLSSIAKIYIWTYDHLIPLLGLVQVGKTNSVLTRL